MRAVTVGATAALTAMITLSSPAAQAAPATGQASVAESSGADPQADVRRLEQLVTDAEANLQRLTVEAEAVADKNLIAQAELTAAQQEAKTAAAAFAASVIAVDRAQDDVAALGRETYMGVDDLGSAAVLLAADSPTEVLQRAATLDVLGDDKAERLDQLEVVESQQQAADKAAQDAVTARDEAARDAAEAERVAQEKLAAAQQTYDAAVADKTVLEQQLQAAEEKLRAASGVRAAATPAPETTASSSQAATASGIPTSGRVTSCYGARWGTMHYGVDIAAPIGTPIYAPQEGVVLQAGPATGFGLAVYIQHADGTITVYGHINSYSVSAGQQVAAGQLIAEVGNRGQSTGPHLHFEVQQGGLYQNRTDPMPWLAARGMPLAGSCA